MLWSIIKKPPKDYKELLNQMEKYINVKEAQWLWHEYKSTTPTIEREKREAR